MHIRNFVIIAHIDHGKSTLADRFLELTKTVEKRKMQEQVLDAMDLERERGITIKLQPVRMKYNFQDSDYILNLIDTPGHIDFTYEVSRALAAVEGAILLVDATQGVQAQTVANVHLATKEKLVIIPVINKIDLKEARIFETENEIKKLLPDYSGEILKISAKTGVGIENVLAEVIKKVPPPRQYAEKSFRALIFDSKFDAFKGVIAYVRLVEGDVTQWQKIFLKATAVRSEVLELGYFIPEFYPQKKLTAGEIGYIATGIKEPGTVRVGDTIVASEDCAPLLGYREPQPMIFASIYPEDADDYENLRDALQKLRLNDPALSFEVESSESLGRGFRAGFLGMLHVEIVSERLKREYSLQLIFSTPSVPYRIKLQNKGLIDVHAPSEIPDEHNVEWIEEPWAHLEILTPKRFLGNIMKLLEPMGGIFGETEYLGEDRLLFSYQAPLRVIVVDFYDRLKSASEGYASMNYTLIGFQKGDLARLDILVAGKKVNALSQVLEKKDSYEEGKKILERLKKILPRQLFMVSLQAAISGRIIARENLAALGKNVTQHLYGGDRTRKMKLWKKQKEGKKRLKREGEVDIPHEVYLKVFKKH